MSSSVKGRSAVLVKPEQRMTSRYGFLAWVVGVAVALGALMAFAVYVNVPTDLTPEDELMLSRLHLVRNSRPAAFELQIAQIQAVQRMVLASSPVGRGIPEGGTREPADLFGGGQGLCFDRSRTLDKAYSFLGYKSRHVYILYSDNKSFVKAVLNRGQNSHAVTEVKTAKGWLVVDSNSPWVAVTKTGQPVPADGVWLRKDEFVSIPTYFTMPAWVIHGLYSRHGQFYPPYLRFPNVNWRDLFLSWLD